MRTSIRAARAAGERAQRRRTEGRAALRGRARARRWGRRRVTLTRVARRRDARAVMSFNCVIAASVLGALAGCSAGGGRGGLVIPLGDAGALVDLAAAPEFAVPRDLATAPDGAAPADLTSPPDVAQPPDLLVVKPAPLLILEDVSVSAMGGIP